jgi:hypothetical protein
MTSSLNSLPFIRIIQKEKRQGVSHFSKFVAFTLWRAALYTVTILLKEKNPLHSEKNTVSKYL